MNRFAFAMMAGFFLFLGLGTLFYSFSKCGWKTFLYGNGAVYAAASGACDK